MPERLSLWSKIKSAVNSNEATTIVSGAASVFGGYSTAESVLNRNIEDATFSGIITLIFAIRAAAGATHEVHKFKKRSSQKESSI